MSKRHADRKPPGKLRRHWKRGIARSPIYVRLWSDAIMKELLRPSPLSVIRSMGWDQEHEGITRPTRDELIQLKL